MLHIDLYSDSNLEDVAEQILADTGLSNVSLSPNAAYDSTMNQNINREVLPMAICMVLVFASGYQITSGNSVKWNVAVQLSLIHI